MADTSSRPTREQVDAELARVDNRYSCTDELHRFLAAEVRALRADQNRTATPTPDAIAELVRRMDTAEAKRDDYREQLHAAHRATDERIADLVRELERRERGLTNALWRALAREPGTDRDLIESIRNLVAVRGKA